jgi:hypothetical protein
MGYQCRAYITSGGATIGATNLALRVQNVTINGDLSREELKELGNLNTVSKKLTTPLKLTATVEVSDNDLKLFATLCGAAKAAEWTTYDSSQAQDFILRSANLATDSKLTVEMYKTRTGDFTTAANKLSMIVMSGLSVTGKSTSTSSSTRGTMSWTFQGSYFLFSGYNQANT